MKKLLAAMFIISSLQIPVHAQSMMDLAYINTVMDDSYPNKTDKNTVENVTNKKEDSLIGPAPKNMSTFNKVATTIVGFISLGVLLGGIMLIIAPLLPNRD